MPRKTDGGGLAPLVPGREGRWGARPMGCSRFYVEDWGSLAHLQGERAHESGESAREPRWRQRWSLGTAGG